MPELLQGELTGRIIDVFHDVHRTLGHGFSEVIYQRAMAIALTDAGLPNAREVETTVRFRGYTIGRYRLDLVVDDAVVLECKVARQVEPEHCAQLLNYLKATRYDVGLVLTFGRRPVRKRLVFQHARSPLAPPIALTAPHRPPCPPADAARRTHHSLRACDPAPSQSPPRSPPRSPAP